MFAKYLIKEGAILKSINDKKKYKLITLINGLRALLISDISDFQADCPSSPAQSVTSSDFSQDDGSVASEETQSIGGEQKEGKKLCGAALSVKVGTLSDPINVQGLAHLLEHVILMGNKEYPEENSFDTFLNRKSGYVNAQTEYEATVYEFQVPNRYLQESLQRFAAIFVSPLFRESSLLNEIRPVDNEFLNSLNDDECRTDSLFASLAQPDHDLSKFTYGNEKSLIEMPKSKGIDLNAELVNFWSQHYHASNMNLVVQSEYDLEIMEKWVVEYFSRIPTQSNSSYNPRENRVNSSEIFPYQEDKFCKLFYIEPVTSGDYFYINFWLPPKFNNYKCKPLAHLGSLLGDEGKGSLFSILKKKGFALEMVAGSHENGFSCNRHQALFSIQVKLTPVGLENLDQVIDYIWTFIDLIKTSGPQRNHLEEDQAIRLYSFAYANEKSGTRNCVKIAENMTHYDTEHILTGPKIIFQIDEEMIGQVFPHMIPSRANYMIFSKKLFNLSKAKLETEKWYGTNYKVIDIPERWLTFKKPVHFDVDVSFPVANDFIPDNFDIKSTIDSNESDYPACIKETLNWRLWYKLGTKYEVPKVCVNMVFRSPMVRSYPLMAAALDVFVRALIMKAEEDVYPASLAGFRYFVMLHDNGLILSFVGFNDKISKFISLIVDHLVSLEFDEISFNNIRRDLSNEYYNSFNDSTELSSAIRLSILKPFFWNSLVRRTFLPQLTREMVISSGRQILANSFLECLVLGNVTSADALAIVKQVALKVGSSPTYQYTIAQDRVNQLPPGQHICRVLAFNKEDKSSSITNYYQIGPVDLRSGVLNELLSSSMYESLFDTLRSQEGLGYSVYNSHHQTSGIAGFSVNVISDAEKFDCSFIDSRIEAFLVKFSGTLMAMSEEEFDETVKGLIKVKSAPFITLNEETKFFWNEILEQEYRFDKRLKDIAALNELTLSEFITWSYIQLLDTPHRRKLSIQIVANGSKALNESYGIERNPFIPRRLDCDDKEGIINGTVNCKEFDKSSDNPMVCQIDENFVKNHECSHLLGRQKRSATFDEDEDNVYILKHLGPRSISSDTKLIVDISEFKRYLTIYPKMRKLYPHRR